VDGRSGSEVERPTWWSSFDDRRDARKNRWLDRGSSAYDLCAAMFNLLEHHDRRHVPMHEVSRLSCTSDVAGIEVDAAEEEGAAPASVSERGRPLHGQPPWASSPGR
jgi:hypothetical protein